MSRLIRVFVSRESALGLMAAAGCFAGLGAFWPGGSGGLFFSTWSFWIVVTALAAALLVSLALRLPAVRSIRSFGSVLLHLSLVLLVLGGAINYRQTRAARLEIIEGQVQPLPGSNISIRLERLHPFYRPGQLPKGDAADVTVFDECYPVKREIIHINRPLEYAGYRIYLDKHGFAPYLNVNGNGTGESFGGFVSLQTNFGPDTYYWRDVEFPGVALRATAIFRPSTDGPFPRAPRMKLVARAGQGNLLGSGEIFRNESLKAGAYGVSFGEVRYWASFQVRRDPGLRLIFASFWLAILGAATALLPRLFHG